MAFLPAAMHRGTSSSSSSADRLRQPPSDDTEFVVRSHPPSVTRSKSPVRFQIQKHTPVIIQHKSNKAEGSLRHAVARKLLTPQGLDSSDTRTEALKNLSLYASEDSDSEHINEVVSLDKSNSGSINMVSAKKGNKHEHQRVDTQPKIDSSRLSSSHRHQKKEHSDVRDTELWSGYGDRGESERKRSSLSKERHSGKEREVDKYKDVSRNRTSRDRVKSPSGRQYDKKCRTDGKAEADRSNRHSDCNAKKSHDSLRHSAEKKPQMQPDSSMVHQSVSNRHRESSHGLKEPKKPERDLSAVESKNVIPSTSTRKSPSRADGDTSRRKSSNSVSRLTNKEMANVEAGTVKPKPKEAGHRKVDTDLKPARNDCHLHADEQKADTAKTAEKLKSVDIQKQKLVEMANVEAGTVKPKPKEAEHCKVDTYLKPARNDRRLHADEQKPDTAKKAEKLKSIDIRKQKSGDKMSKVKDEGHVDDKKDKDVQSLVRKAASSSALLCDKRSVVKRKRDSVTTSSSSSYSSSGSGSSSSSDSDSGSGSSSSSSSSSDSSDEDDIAATDKKSGQLKSGLQKDAIKLDTHSSLQKPMVQKDTSKPHAYSDPQKPEACDVSEVKSELDGDKQADETITGNVSVDTRHELMAVARTEEATAVLDKLAKQEKSMDYKSESTAVHPTVSEAQVPVAEALTQTFSVDLYSPSFPTDEGWEEVDDCGDAAGWSTSSESDVDDVPPPPPPARPPSNSVQPSSSADIQNSVNGDGNDHSCVVAKPTGSKQDVTAAAFNNTATDNVGSNACSVSNNGKPTDGGINLKDGQASALPKTRDCRTEAVPSDEKSCLRRSDKQPAPDSRSRTELDRGCLARSRSSHSNSRSRHNHSRSRSRERRRRMPDDDGGPVHRHRSTRSDKISSRRRDVGYSESPAAVCRIDRPDTSPIRRSTTHSGSSSRRAQNSDMRQTSSYNSYRSKPTVRSPGNAVGGNAFKSDELVVVIDTDDEDVENIENIPLPVPLPNIMLDDIPLPVPIGESSDVAVKECSPSEIHSVEKESDSAQLVKQGDESTSEKQMGTEEEVVKGEDESADNIDMDLDDSSDGSCQNDEKNVATVETDSCKEPVLSTGKIVLSLGSHPQPGREQTTSVTESSEASAAFAFAWKRKLGAGLLKAPKLVNSMTEPFVKNDSLVEKSNENLESVTSTTSEVRTISDPSAEVKREIVSEKLPPQTEAATKSDASSSYNAREVGKSNSNSGNSCNTTAARQKPRRRFSDLPPEKSTNLSDDLPSELKPETVQTVQVVQANVLTGQQFEHHPGEGTNSIASDHSTLEHSTSAGDKCAKLANQNGSMCAEKTVVDAVFGENRNSVSRISQMEQKPDSCGFKNPSSSVVEKERRFSERKRSGSPIMPAKKETEQQRSSTSRAEKQTTNSSKGKCDTDTSKSRQRNSSSDERKKQPSSNRHRSKSPYQSMANKRRSGSRERRLHGSRDRSGKDDDRCLSSRRKDSSPERRLSTAGERDVRLSAKNDDSRLVRKSSDAQNVEISLHDVKSRERHTSAAVVSDISSSHSSHRRSPVRSPKDRRHEQDKNREVKKSSRGRRSTSKDKLMRSHPERNERESHYDVKVDSRHHADVNSLSWHNNTAASQPHPYQDDLSSSIRDASGRSYEHKSRRSPSCDKVSKPRMDDISDRFVYGRHAAEKSDRTYEFGSRRKSPSYDDELVFQNQADRLWVRRRSSSKERHSSVQGRDRCLLKAKDYTCQKLSVDDDRSHKTEKPDKYEGFRSRHNREYPILTAGDYSSEEFPAREEDIGHLKRRCDSSPDQPCCLLSPSELQKLPRHSKHFPLPNDRSERSTQYRRSLSRERSPKYRGHESLGQHVENYPSLSDDESRFHGFEKKSYDRDERSPSRSREDVSCNRRSPPRNEKDHFYDRQTSPLLDRGLPASPSRRELFARMRRSASRDRRYVEQRESIGADHGSRSPSQSAISRRRDTSLRSGFSLQEEFERHLQQKRNASTGKRSPSPVYKRGRESSDQRSGSRDRRSRSGSRELLRSPDGRKYHRSRSDKRDDSRSRHGSYSPTSRSYRESRHSNRDIVQFLMDTGIIGSSKSKTKCRDPEPAATRSPTSVVSTSVSTTQSVATSAAVTAAASQVTPLSTSSFISSYPVVPSQAIMPGPIMPQMPYVDNASVPYVACNPYPPAFPAAPAAAAPSPWYPAPVVQPCSSFSNQIPNQATPVPYPGIQPVPVMPLMGPGPPPAVQQCPVPQVHSTPAPDWHGSYGQTYNRFLEPMNQSSFRQREDHTIKPRPTYGAGMSTASGHAGSADRLKQESGVQQHHSANSALRKAIESAVWIPSVDFSIQKSTRHVTESEPSVLSDNMTGNSMHLEVSVTSSTGLIEPTDKTVCEKSVEQQVVGGCLSAVETSPAGCLWECIPEIVVDANSLAAMEAENEAEDPASESDSKSRKRRRGQNASDSGGDTRRRSSRLRSKEEQKKLDKVDEDSDDHPPDLASRSVSDTELSKPPVKNLKARILQEYESDTGHSNPSSSSGTTEACLDATTSVNSVTEAVYKIPDDSYSSMVTKPEKVKSRWRRWSELETDGEQHRAPPPPPPPPLQSPSSTTGTPANSAVEDEDIVEEKPPYFEPILDNIFLSSRFVSLH